MVARQIETCRQDRCYGLRAETDVTTTYLSCLFDLVVYRTDNVARRSKPKAFVASRSRNDQRIDAHDLSLQVHQWAPAAPGIDRCVGLHVDHRRLGLQLTRNSADHSERHGIVKAQRTAEGQYE